MKKLMIAAAIVCAAAISHAAVATWGFSSTEIYDSEDSDYLYTGTAMLFKGVVEAVSNGDGTYSLKFGEGVSLVGDPVAQNGDGTFGPTDYANAVNLAGFSADGGDAYSLILFESDDVVDYQNYEGKYFLVTGDSEKTQDKKSLEYYVNMNYKNGFAGDDWKTAAAAPVPEPTSGLLLLLGVAGMALRRRRA